MSYPSYNPSQNAFKVNPMNTKNTKNKTLIKIWAALFAAVIVLYVLATTIDWLGKHPWVLGGILFVIVVPFTIIFWYYLLKPRTGK
jgi:membrane protein YdbS with pleckstrin-like domain